MNGRLGAVSPMRLATVLSFVAACAVFVGYMWLHAGGSIAGFKDIDGYRFSAEVADVDNLVQFSDVAIAGVDRKSTRLNSSHRALSRMPSSA